MFINYITFSYYSYFQSVIGTTTYLFKCLVGTITYFLHNTTKEVFTPQSGALGTSQSPGMTNLSQEITAFSDQSAGWTTTIGSGSDPTMDLAATADSDLGNFLGRPVRIAEYNWGVGSGLFQRFNPWTQFLGDSRVKEKTANFELYRSKLHVKMVVSGTGFHYGRALVSYNPLYGRDDVTVQRSFLQSDLVAASQKPHFFINPTTNAGGQLDLPFFYPDNYLSLTRSSEDVGEMGEITIKSFDSLRHANGGTGNVTITIYAWASDVILAMPTSLSLSSSSFTPQSGKMNSGDEYGKGIISKPASAIARAAGHLTSVPVIAPYARATQMCAMAAGEVANHWGYSRPAIVSDIVKFKPNPTGNMANTDAAEALSRLTLDSKQELTIDSRTVGLDGEDQMDVSRFCQRESYLDTFTMDEAQSPDSLLWNSKVTPVLFRQEGTSGTFAELHPTPMAMMSVPFEKWQGSIKYRFQIVKSNFHKGRLLVRWDPRSNGSNIEYNTTYSRVVDLGEEDDFEICIGWGQKEPFLELSEIVASINPPFRSSSRYPSDNTATFNGVLEIAVLNSLVSPAISSPISINVFVSACDDIKFGQPAGDKLTKYSLFRQPVARRSEFTPQSGEISDGLAIAGTSEGATDVPVGADSIAPIAKTTEVADQTMNVFFGESVSSLRQLFRRYVKHRTYVTLPTNIPGDIGQTVIEDPGLGLWTGWDPNGIDTVQGNPCNITIPTFAQFFTPCYAGWRGSTRAKYAFGGKPGNNPIVTRGSNVPLKYNIVINETDEGELEKTLTFLQGSSTSAGSATTNIGINDTIEVEFPYYQRSRFITARKPSADFCNGAKGGRIEMLTNAESDIGAVINTWKSVGEDFTLFFFTGCPILYANRITP